jgi:hypothetical protein
LALSEPQVSGHRAALPQLGRCFDWCVAAIFAAKALGSFVDTAAFQQSCSKNYYLLAIA